MRWDLAFNFLCYLFYELEDIKSELMFSYFSPFRREIFDKSQKINIFIPTIKIIEIVHSQYFLSVHSIKLKFSLNSSSEVSIESFHMK